MQPLIPWFEPFSIPISGNIGIHGFGILVALGFWIGSNAGMAKARRDNLDPEIIYKLVVWVVLSTFIGLTAQLFGLFGEENMDVSSIPREIDSGFWDTLWWTLQRVLYLSRLETVYGGTTIIVSTAMTMC